MGGLGSEKLGHWPQVAQLVSRKSQDQRRPVLSSCDLSSNRALVSPDCRQGSSSCRDFPALGLICLALLIVSSPPGWRSVSLASTITLLLEPTTGLVIIFIEKPCTGGKTGRVSWVCRKVSEDGPWGPGLGGGACTKRAGMVSFTASACLSIYLSPIYFPSIIHLSIIHLSIHHPPTRTSIHPFKLVLHHRCLYSVWGRGLQSKGEATGGREQSHIMTFQPMEDGDLRQNKHQSCWVSQRSVLRAPKECGSFRIYLGELKLNLEHKKEKVWFPSLRACVSICGCYLGLGTVAAP